MTHVTHVQQIEDAMRHDDFAGALAGFGQEFGEVVDRRRLLDLEHGEDEPLRWNDDHADVMRFDLRDRFGQCSEIGFPGILLLAEVTELTLHKGRAFAELQGVLRACHDHFPFVF